MHWWQSYGRRTRSQSTVAQKRSWPLVVLMGFCHLGKLSISVLLLLVRIFPPLVCAVFTSSANRGVAWNGTGERIIARLPAGAPGKTSRRSGQVRRQGRGVSRVEPGLGGRPRDSRERRSGNEGLSPAEEVNHSGGNRGRTSRLYYLLCAAPALIPRTLSVLQWLISFGSEEARINYQGDGPNKASPDFLLLERDVAVVGSICRSVFVCLVARSCSGGPACVYACPRPPTAGVPL